MQPDSVNQQPIEKVFVNAEGQATIVCANCNTPKVFNVLHLLNRPHYLRVRCYCGNAFMVKLDFRQCYRKETKLPGSFTMLPPSLERGVGIVADLSITGLRFLATASHKLKIGQRGYIEFDLDNKKKTHIRKEFVIRKLKGNELGLQFTENEAFEKELGFYMRFGG
ncbi:MAG: PilZ domain-containing protein [Desulfobulbaceae bacterium]|jgi:hypothetical protein|nr:PilZ domain-containing protein [Desulfobulbaceae bacterium]